MREGERKEPWTVGDSATYVACWISSGRRRYVRECVTEQSRREFEFDLSLILGFFLHGLKIHLKVHLKNMLSHLDLRDVY